MIIVDLCSKRLGNMTIFLTSVSEASCIINFFFIHSIMIQQKLTIYLVLSGAVSVNYIECAQ